MRRKRFRSIQSALAQYTSRSPPFSKSYTRECSRKRPTMERTLMRSETPGTPGLKQHTPRTMSSTATPAREARYRA